MVQAVLAHKPSDIHTNARKNTPLNTWRALCQSHSRYSHLSKENDGGTGTLQEERDGEMMKKEEEKKRMRAPGGEEAYASNKYVITRHEE